MAIVYEVFEFTQGKSLKDTNGPITYIKVEDGEDKFEVLGCVGLPGSVYGYGLAEVSDTISEQMKLAQTIRQYETLAETLAVCLEPPRSGPTKE